METNCGEEDHNYEEWGTRVGNEKITNEAYECIKYKN